MNTEPRPGGQLEPIVSLQQCELLALAAKEAGYKIGMWIDGDEPYSGGAGYVISSERFEHLWNPLNDDGDALRLAIDAGLIVNPNSNCRRGHASVQHHTNIRGHWWYEPHGSDKAAAVRRAIVRAAAECGDV